MNKALAFLEKNVQWIALAVGGAVFLCAVYFYWLVPDLSVPVAGRDVGPADVDKAVDDGPGRQLRGRIDDPRVPDFEVPVLTVEFDKNLDIAGPVGELASGVMPQPTIDLRPPNQRTEDAIFVSEMVVPPPANVREVSTGRVDASVVAAVPEGQPQPVAEQRDLAVVQVLYKIKASQIAIAMGQTALSPRQQATSVLHVTVQRERLLPDGTWGEMTPIERLANNPLPEPPAESASVEAKRSYLRQVESQSQWVLQPPFYETLGGEDPMVFADRATADGEESAVAAAPQRDTPKAGIDPSTKMHYGFDPADNTTWPAGGEMTIEEKRAIREYNRNKNKNQNPNNGGRPGGSGGYPGGGYPPGGGGGYGGYGGGGGGYGGYPPGGGADGRGVVPEAPGGTVNAVQQRNPRDDRQGGGSQGSPYGDRSGTGGGPGEEGPSYGGGYGGSPYGGGSPYPGGGGTSPYPGGGGSPYGAYPGSDGGQGQPQGPQGPTLAPPPGTFNPGELGDQDIEGWAWDTGAEAGETYRYRVLYSLKNPLFETQNIADPKQPELTTTLLRQSDADATAWGPELTVKPMTYYYMTGNTPDDQQIIVTVFHFQNGKFQGSQFKVSPGDPVGQAVAGIRYDTGDTLVDIRRDPSTGQLYGLAVDDQGRFTRRTSEDTKDEQYKKLQQEVSNATASAAAPGR